MLEPGFCILQTVNFSCVSSSLRFVCQLNFYGSKAKLLNTILCILRFTEQVKNDIHEAVMQAEKCEDMEDLSSRLNYMKSLFVAKRMTLGKSFLYKTRLLG